MDNVKMTVNGNKLNIEVDLSKAGSPSSSGKSLVIATTKGNQDVPKHAGVKIGLNVYKKA